MYHPSRGGVRGGADQFSWENVKTDKHRENYLGHSLKAPVGRWQKGKDLGWYYKERNQGKIADGKSSELAAVKKAEEEAMLIALGHKSVRREMQPLSKEEMAEALKRGQCERDSLNVERIEGIGISSGRAALITKSGSGKTEGVDFEGLQHTKQKVDDIRNHEEVHSYGKKNHSDQGCFKSKKREKHKKSKKKHKKKHKKRSRTSSDSDTEEGIGFGSKHKVENRSHLCEKSESRQYSSISKRQRHDSSSDSD